MKKNFFSLCALCALVFNTAFGATVQRTILSHQGVITQYDAIHWSDAITNAVAGDTIYFTAGSFGDDNVNANLVIDKPITLIGAGVAASDAFFNGHEYYGTEFQGYAKSGESTLLKTNITIAIPGSVTLTSTVLEGFKIPSCYGFEPTVTITESVTGLKIKRCQIDNTFYVSESATATNLVLEDCSIGRLSTARMVNPDIQNCMIFNLSSDTEEIEFTNCQFEGIEGSCANCHYVNCILRSLPDYNTFNYCTYWQSESAPHGTISNCWRTEWWTYMTKEQLQQGNYLGTDGTVVGPLGGSAPFTFYPSQPYVSSSTLTYDKNTQKLNVNITVNQGK